jgi:hypothetical protein
MSRKAVQEAKSLFKELGVQMAGVSFTGRTHLRVVGITPGGHHFQALFPHTPGDWRYMRNQRADIRRLIRVLDNNEAQKGNAS